MKLKLTLFLVLLVTGLSTQFPVGAQSPVGPADMRFSTRSSRTLPQPLALYDFVNVSGTTVYDLSGNGRDGTAANVTFSSAGATMNGTSSYINIPAMVANANFTAIAVAWGVNTSGGCIWCETKSTAGTTLLWMGGSQANNFVRDGNGNGGEPNYGTCCTSAYPVYHVYVLSRSGQNATVQVLDSGLSSTTSVGVANILSTDLASLGARHTATSTHDLYWKGAIAYFGIWSGSLSATALKDIYHNLHTIVAARKVRLPNLVLPLTSGPTWVRQGDLTVVGGAVMDGEEATVLHESGCLAVASPCFKMWYSGTVAPHFGNVVYAESVDGLTNWTIVGDAKVPGGQSWVAHVGATYYLYTGGGTQVTVYTSADGLNFGSGTVAIAKGSSGAVDDNGVYNSSVIYDATDGWKMIYDCVSVAVPYYHGCYATSLNGLTWTKSTLNPIDGNYSGTAMGGPLTALNGAAIYKINGQYWVWGHLGEPPSDIYRFFWGDGTGYAQAYPVTKTFARGTVTDETGANSQVADPVLVEVGGQVYMYYEATTDGYTPPYFHMKCAIFSGTMAQLIATSETATASTP